MRRLNDQHEVWYSDEAPLETVLQDVRDFVLSNDGDNIVSVAVGSWYDVGNEAIVWNATVVLS